MKEILLTKGQVALVDDDDFESLSKHKWCLNQAGKNSYARRKFFQGTKYVRILMHRQLLTPPAGMEIDHIDGNGLNNQRNNLRVCTHAQNIQNKRMMSNNTSGLRGVYPKKNRWVAQICVSGKSIWVGSFKAKEEAYQAYLEAARTHHGEFAHLV